MKREYRPKMITNGDTIARKAIVSGDFSPCRQAICDLATVDNEEGVNVALSLAVGVTARLSGELHNLEKAGIARYSRRIPSPNDMASDAMVNAQRFADNGLMLVDMFEKIIATGAVKFQPAVTANKPPANGK